MCEGRIFRDFIHDEYIMIAGGLVTKHLKMIVMKRKLECNWNSNTGVNTRTGVPLYWKNVV